MRHRWKLSATALTLIHFLLLSVDSSFANIVNCGVCVCDRFTLTCDFDSARNQLKGDIHLGMLIPSQAQLEAVSLQPSSFEELYVNCKNTPLMTEQRLSRELLAHFSSLKKVIIVRCDLQMIDADALQTLTRLEEFDASDNNLRQLPARMFNRLSMKQVKLSENRRLQLNNSLAFEGMTLRQLILSKCRLTEFPTDALIKINGLKELTLSENEISLVPRAAQEVVSKLTVFYLDGNPLDCTCANRWLRESVNWDLVSPAAMRKPKLPTCKSPFSLMDIELTKIEPSRFLCPPPRIASVDLQLGQDSASLTCLADQREDGRPLDWFLGSSPIYSGFSLHHLVRRVAGLDSQRLAVRVADLAGHSAQLNLTIIWPPPPPKQTQPPLPTLPLPGEAPNEGEAAIPETPTGQRGGGSGSSDNSKQFTLLEMIIAVIGTFMSTSLIFLLSCQFVRWYKRRDKKLWATYVSHHQHQLPHPQQHQHLPPHPHQPYSATYTYNPHQPSSHEYDVPRIDQSCLPKPAPPSQTLPTGMGVGGGGGGGGGSGCGGSSMSSSDREFLDFNNPRLMYNV